QTRRGFARPQRRAFFGRAAGISPQRPRSHAPAPRGRQHYGFARHRLDQLSGELHARGRDESVRLRLSDRPAKRMHLHAAADSALQLPRFDKTRVHANAQMGTREIKRHCAVNADAEKLLETAINKLGLSARAYSRVLKVARTIADLAGEENIEAAHIAEAIQYRSLDRRM